MPKLEDRLAQRARLLAAAADLLESQGPVGLQARQVTAAVGASTQAIYTYFGGMPGLIDGLIAQGYADLSRVVSAVAETDDPVADFLGGGWALARWALSHPRLYRLMFGLDGERMHVRLDAGRVVGAAHELAAFGVLEGAVRRMIDDGRIRDADPILVGGQFLATTHGFVLLAIAGLYGDQTGFDVASEAGVNLLVGLGDLRERAERSLARAVELGLHPTG